MKKSYPMTIGNKTYVQKDCVMEILNSDELEVELFLHNLLDKKATIFDVPEFACPVTYWYVRTYSETRTVKYIEKQVKEKAARDFRRQAQNK